MLDLTGRTLGPYQLIERLEGDQAYAIYRAVEPRRFGQTVAVTVFAAPTDDEAFMQRFERAAEALTALRHPTILPLHDFGEGEGLAYLAAPYIEAPSLASALGRPRRLTEALGLIAILCDALDHAHRLGLAHGGLAPETIALTNLPPGEDTLQAAWPLLRDFGFAEIIGPAAVAPAIAVYQPPEGRGEDGARADIYALAAILHALLTGWPADMPADEAPAAPLPDALDATLRRALAPTPTERFGSGGEFLLALQEAVAGDQRGEDESAVALLEEARAAVTAGKFRAASDAYGAYLRLRPNDELARREFVTVEARRVETAKRRTGLAATAPAAATPTLPEGVAPTGDNAATTAPGGVAPAIDAAPSIAPSAPMPAPKRPLFDWGALRQIAGVGSAAGPPRLAPPTAPATPPAPDPPITPPVRSALTGSALTRPRPAGPQTFKPIAAPAQQRQRSILPVTLVALALVLALALGGATLARRGADRGGTATAVAPAQIAASSTRTTGVGGTPSRAVATGVPTGIPVAPVYSTPLPTPTATLPPKDWVIFDGFDNLFSGFPAAPGGQEGTGYQNSEYVLRVPTPDGYEIVDLTGCPINGDCAFGDLEVEVDIRAIGPTAGGSYGLVFHRVDRGGSFEQYFVLIDPEAGTVQLNKWIGTESTPLVARKTDPAIKRGGETNHLMVSTKGAQITIQINGIEVARVSDTGPTRGILGLRADAGTAPIEVHFDNFIVRPVR